MAIHPYLFFNGNCADAFTRYKEVFGGELVLIKAADMPEDERPPAGAEDLIMHAALKIGDELLMASDDPTGGAGGVQGMMVNYSVTDTGEAKRIFDALAEGGEVRLPLGPTSWSPAFGMCVDQFGTPWMVSTDPAS